MLGALRCQTLTFFEVEGGGGVLDFFVEDIVDGFFVVVGGGGGVLDFFVDDTVVFLVDDAVVFFVVVDGATLDFFVDVDGFAEEL